MKILSKTNWEFLCIFYYLIWNVVKKKQSLKKSKKCDEKKMLNSFLILLKTFSLKVFKFQKWERDFMCLQILCS